MNLGTVLLLTYGFTAICVVLMWIAYRFFTRRSQAALILGPMSALSSTFLTRHPSTPLLTHVASRPLRDNVCEFKGCDDSFSDFYDLLLHRQTEHNVPVNETVPKEMFQEFMLESEWWTDFLAHFGKPADDPSLPPEHAEQLNIMVRKALEHCNGMDFSNCDS